MPESGVELVPLVGHLAQAHIRRASGRQRRPAGRRGDLQCLPAGPGGRVQAALGPLDLAELIAGVCSESGPVGGPPSGDAGPEGALGLGEPAAEPLGHGQAFLDVGAQPPLILAASGQGLRRECHRGVRVTAELGEDAAQERDQRGGIHQQAAGPARSRLERLPGCPRGRALGRVEQRLHRLQTAAEDRHKRLPQQQPGPRPDQVLGQRRQPSVNRRRFTAQEEDRVVMPLDQPGGPGHLPGGHRVPDRIVGQPALLIPGRSVTVQHRNPAGLFLLQPGAQQVGEQVMVAPPAAHLIERHQEQPGPLHLLQQRLAPGPAGHRVAQRAGQPLQHRGLQQEGAYLLALALEYLLGQKVQHVAVAAGKRCHEPGDICLPAQRQGR